MVELCQDRQPLPLSDEQGDSMKIEIDIDCSPEEARNFLGLPDVKPLHDAMIAEIEERMKSGLAAMDPETLMKTWLPTNLQGLEQIQKAFWSQMMGGAETGKKEK